MIELIRIINEDTLFSYRATQNEEEGKQLELLFGLNKPNYFLGWHSFIAASFVRNPPHPAARFRPYNGKNVFYGSLKEETALYEQAFYLIKERKHLKISPDSGTRTIFSVDANENGAIQIRHEPNAAAIIDKNNYLPSHQFIMQHPETIFLFYSSCRDPQHRDNAAVLDIHRLKKNLTWEAPINFFYDNNSHQLTWLEYSLNINWSEVS